MHFLHHSSQTVKTFSWKLAQRNWGRKHAAGLDLAVAWTEMTKHKRDPNQIYTQIARVNPMFWRIEIACAKNFKSATQCPRFSVKHCLQLNTASTSRIEYFLSRASVTWAASAAATTCHVEQVTLKSSPTPCSYCRMDARNRLLTTGGDTIDFHQSHKVALEQSPRDADYSIAK